MGKLAKIRTAALTGLDAVPVDVEVRQRSSGAKFTIIGLGDSAVKEARDRVALAVGAVGLKFPSHALVNLAPAEIKKEGSGFDLPIAVGALLASEQITLDRLQSAAFFGELSLSGAIKPVRGVLALVIAALKRGSNTVVVPEANAKEAALLSGVEVVGLRHLTELLKYLRGEDIGPRLVSAQPPIESRQERIIFEDVIGQEKAKRALLIAAAGAHNLLMIGAPGCGKSMLAGRFSRLLPKLSREEMLEVVKVYSISGLSTDRVIAGERPYRAPHHVISAVGLSGGGANLRPGEISLAHNGVLFLDEFPEYQRSVIECLRAPLESGQILITRAKGGHTFPARFQLLAAMNPCPCGRLGVPQVSCLCSRGSIQQYLKKLSRPILDRIDLHTELDAIPAADLTKGLLSKSDPGGVPGIGWPELVAEARNIQYERYGALNAHVDPGVFTGSIEIKSGVLELLERLTKEAGLSARGYVRTLRVAQSIADLEGCPKITEGHVAEAFSFRSLNKIEAYCSPAS